MPWFKNKYQEIVKDLHYVIELLLIVRKPITRGYVPATSDQNLMLAWKGLVTFVHVFIQRGKTTACGQKYWRTKIFYHIFHTKPRLSKKLL